jgi:hypothetical protein
MVKEKSNKYYTLTPSDWDSYESKCIRNNVSFEIGFIRESKKQPDRLMVYPTERKLNGKTHVTYHLVEHNLKDTETIRGYSRYNMECKPLYELELVKNFKGNPYAIYSIKQLTGKTPARKIKPIKYPMTKLIL